jgi:hypothetical protein
MKKLLAISMITLISLVMVSCSPKESPKEQIDSYCKDAVKNNLVEFYTMSKETKALLEIQPKVGLKKYNGMMSYLNLKYDESFSDTYAEKASQAKEMLDSNEEIIAKSIMLRTKARCAYELSSIKKVQLIN